MDFLNLTPTHSTFYNFWSISSQNKTFCNIRVHWLHPSWLRAWVLLRVGSVLRYRPIQGFKGALDNFSLIPQFFFKQSWDFCTLRSIYLDVVTACSILLATSTQLQRYMFSAAIFWSPLLKMAAIVMTVEFGNINHYSSLEENSEPCFCSSLARYKY